MRTVAVEGMTQMTFYSPSLTATHTLMVRPSKSIQVRSRKVDVDSKVGGVVYMRHLAPHGD